MISERRSLFLLFTTLLSTLYLLSGVFPLWICSAWGIPLLLGIVQVVKERPFRKNVPFAVAYIFLSIGFVFAVRNGYESTRAVEDWDSIFPKVVENLEVDINERMERHLEDKLFLVETVADEIRSLIEGAGADRPETLRDRLFALLENKRIDQPDAKDLFFLLMDDDLNEVAWSGASYLPQDFSPFGVSPSADTLSIEVFRGNIVTAAVISYPIPMFGGLALYDHLEIRHHLSERYARSERFLDRLSRAVETEIELYPVDGQGAFALGEETILFPFFFGGRHLGNWSIDPLASEGLLTRLESMKTRFLPLLLLFPWILSFAVIKEWLTRSVLHNRRFRRWRHFIYLLLLAGLLLIVRLVLLESSFPASWIGGHFFSPRLFATGLMEEASLSIGEFFISSLMITLFVLYAFSLLTPNDNLLKGGRKCRLPGIFAGLVLACFLSISAPFVLERLLKDTLLSLVINQAFIRSAVTLFWELSLFLMTVSLLLVISMVWRLTVFRSAGTPRIRLILSALWAVLFSLVLFVSLYQYGDEKGTVFGVIVGAMMLVGGALLSVMHGGVETDERRQTAAWFNLPVLILLSSLSAGLLYPGILRYRYLALEETGEDLLDRIGAPYDNWAAFVLEEAADDLADRREEIFSESRDPQGLGFFTWVNSRLSKVGQRTSLVIFDKRGKEISRFSLTDFELEEALTVFFLNGAKRTDEPFLYHGFSGGNEFYAAVVPYWEGGELKNFLTVTLPTDLEERLGGGPIKLFFDESDRGHIRLPSPMTVKVLSMEEGIEGGDGTWRTGRGEVGRYRYLRKRIGVGGVDRVVTVEFPLQGLVETLARVNFLFLVHFLLLLCLWGVVAGGYRQVTFRSKFFAKTFQRKLTIALIVFSIIPTLMFGIVGAREIRRRLDAETRSRAVSGLEAFVHLVERELGEIRGSVGTGEIVFYSTREGVVGGFAGVVEGGDEGLLLDDQYVREASRTIGHDFLLYRDNTLVSTSQEDLVQAGMVPGILGEKPYVELILKGNDYSYHRQSLGNYQYLVASKRLSPIGADESVVLATPLLWREEEVDQEIANLTYLVLMILNGIFLLSSVMGFVVGGFLSRPIALLREAFERVGAGDFRVALDRERKDEFGQLFSSFEVMSRQLETSQRRLSEEKARVDGVLQSVGAGIMAFNRDGVLKVINARAVALVGERLLDQVGTGLERLSFENDQWKELVHGTRTVLDSEELDVQHEFDVSEGEGLKTIRMVATRLVDEKGEGQGVVVAFEDISESVRSQKIMAWGEMARQVAHEIKNPLTPIRLSIQHLYRTFKDGAPDFERIIEDEVRVILREIDRLRRIATDFSRYSQPVTEKARRIDVKPVVQELMELYLKEHGEVRYSFILPDEEVWALASTEGLKKVLVNLIENGREAIEGEGNLDVEVREAEVQGERRVILTVSDTGKGIPRGDIGKIFDPRFSTRSGGAGLGLAICKRVIEGWGGKIEITSREGEGTRVSIVIKGV